MNSVPHRHIDLAEGRERGDDPCPWKSWPDNELPTLTYHIQGNEAGGVFWIDMFSIPGKHRRKGTGKKLWRHFEESIPPKFRIIKLVASDAGDGSSEGFWRKMGFQTESRDRHNGIVMSKMNPAVVR